MLMLDGKGPFYYHDVRIMEYHAFVNSRLQIVEEILTDDGRRSVEINEWDELNDIEKYFALEHGLDIQHMREKLKAEESNQTHQAEIIPFPLSS